MSVLRNVFGGCVSNKSTENIKTEKLKFGVAISVALKADYIPRPFVDLLVYIAKEGVTTTDLFRRPGNPYDTRRIVKRLEEGKPVIFTNYNFYTLASVVKKFLLKLPGGIFTPSGEEKLLEVLNMSEYSDQCQHVNQFIQSLSVSHRQLVSLLFGIWFRIVNHSDINSMTVETLARSVAGSMFLTCADDPDKVELAIRIMQLLIDNFGVANMFGHENITYFTQTTLTGINVREKFRYEYNYPPEEILPRADALPWFNFILQEEAKIHGFDLQQHAINKEEFYNQTLPQVRYQSDEYVGLRRPARFDGSNIRSESVGPNWPSSNRESHSGEDLQLVVNVTTASAPEVSTIPSPDISKRPKSLEDNLNELRSDHKTKCLSRYNSVRRRQLERLRQRSDWFLGPLNDSVCSNRSGASNNQNGENIGSSSSMVEGVCCGEEGIEKQQHQPLKAKISGTSVTKSSSEGAELDVIGSDADSVFTDNTSRSESPASEPIRSLDMRKPRTVIHSDTVVDALSVTENVPDTHDIKQTCENGEQSNVCYFMVKHNYGETNS
ncbi:uncharacterized protein LOC106870372 isoform X1 [Octopus bimaculoides]|uniref:uncharacterized protein LOC106870372 isoform X1 n=1 Tax=Octopus bimaculoides TaxID=37653 RepID=UPI00071C82EF|nr:uncharacterized protein LOC106870372 isoform X1 [Octopus bimaculoides]XP_052823672.1 uncharacterized protein LOC106870372 isoform X1 [Octopus bimaculoides]XP_052823673.1 uncharacterized protein LOC106870372 isoform X1 [Octopus bimaculoides]XP_052823674.1 uncharacterized protein LOC106870372 isoform X1 [Octopus bimaculoides]XP_052823675.1 uncharacterized protein LOC106870372 isoform X1 [Octopus bimaculoides]|eukprot:XP_014771895.1 PREDICTED: uncharacterized protein LOC106870372 isoform X1 [Octopus bimaculoides]